MSRKKYTKHEAAEMISGMRLVQGGGTLADYKKRNQACIMQAVNVYQALISGGDLVGGIGFDSTYVSGSISYSNIPTVCHTIENYMVEFNDSTADSYRQQLLAFIPALLNTDTNELSSYRTKMAAREVISIARRAFRGDYAAREAIAEGFSTYPSDYDTEKGFIQAIKNELGDYFAHTTLGALHGEHLPEEGFEFIKKMLRARDRKAEAERRMARRAVRVGLVN